MTESRSRLGRWKPVLLVAAGLALVALAGPMLVFVTNVLVPEKRDGREVLDDLGRHFVADGVPSWKECASDQDCEMAQWPSVDGCCDVAFDGAMSREYREFVLNYRLANCPNTDCSRMTFRPPSLHQDYGPSCLEAVCGLQNVCVERLRAACKEAGAHGASP